MTQINLLVSTPNLSDDRSKCPFCNEDEHPFPGKKEDNPDYSVVSNPGSLGCEDIADYDADYPWAMAKHHLISAKQCFARLNPIIRMAKMTGYDINGKPNGIGLPTISSKVDYPCDDGTRESYGWGGNSDRKKNIAYKVMTAAKAQWHVGHHSLELEVDPGYEWGDEIDTSTEGHLVKYDVKIVEELIKIMMYWKKPEFDLCNQDSDDDNTDKFIKSMDDLSESIEKKLNCFSSGNPKGSNPLYVSKLAHSYAYESSRQKRSRDGTGLTGPAKKRRRIKK